MTTVDDLLKLIGMATVVVVVSVAVALIFFYAYSAITGIAHSMGQDSQARDQAVSAQSEYNYDLELVKEQTQRLDMYYAAKTSTEMTRAEFQSWLGMIDGLTTEFIKRENASIESGRAYLTYLSPGSDEYNRVVNNTATSGEDIKKVKYTYNGNVYIYNQKYGSEYGEIPYMD
ncbi:MAG TPA: hypothetical protein VMC84_03955 [Methanocella sp.]|uniref:hypothetical protein n=1 Tax=Methanocella sp. TaxID=2052833 RepID=UPI002C47BA06|nr:hypothetical protein [Methanocella sp.]HTY90308.1 hypothetical protein [Methanocella sp.]